MFKRGNVTQIFDLDHPHEVPPEELTQLLGVKGAGLATMSAVLDLPVPAGFTITTAAVAELASGEWSAPFEAELHLHVAHLERSTGRRLGDPANPLLVSVRSGAVVSMPGMLDTVLDVGLDDISVEGLAATTGDERFAYDCFRRFLASYGTHVMGIDSSLFEHPLAELSREPSISDLVQLCERHQRTIAQATGSPVPREAHHQLHRAIEAVARSWHSPRAHSFRAHAGFLQEGATAVTVQAMVHGNRDERSCAGVAFSRNPLTGAAEPFGEIIFGAQGDDVMSGTTDALDLGALEERLPDTYRELVGALGRLEAHMRDLCEVEVTVEQGELWLLQSRVGERTPTAAVRMAVDMALQDGWKISKSEAVARVSSHDVARLEKLATVASTDLSLPVLTRGLPASAGVATGVVCTTVATCIERSNRGEAVILVRPTTSPADVMGMRVAAGVLTTSGGPASHAAVVARAWNIPTVVGAGEIVLDEDDGLKVRSTSIASGDVITIDGSSGEVFLGSPPARHVRPPAELETLLAWRDEP